MADQRNFGMPQGYQPPTIGPTELNLPVFRRAVQERPAPAVVVPVPVAPADVGSRSSRRSARTGDRQPEPPPSHPYAYDGMSFQEWLGMSRSQRADAGMPVSTIGGQWAFRGRDETGRVPMPGYAGRNAARTGVPQVAADAAPQAASPQRSADPATVPFSKSRAPASMRSATLQSEQHSAGSSAGGKMSMDQFLALAKGLNPTTLALMYDGMPRTTSAKALTPKDQLYAIFGNIGQDIRRGAYEDPNATPQSLRQADLDLLRLYAPILGGDPWGIGVAEE